MRTWKTAACLAAVTALLTTGCSDDGGDDDRVQGVAKSDGPASPVKSDVTVEIKVTGDSPASVYIPGILFDSKDKKSADDPDLDLDHIKTPFSKKLTSRPGRSLSMQVASEKPSKEIGCQIYVDGKLKAQERKKMKPGYTLNTTCTTTTS
ncbi:hypothetical protein [Streptomyces sp. NBC_01187]|nr:hypothetical protein OG220_16885 [Streptomyces sp. NBC_01187]